MNYVEAYKAVVAEGFSHETALAVNLGLLLNVSKPVTMENLEKVGLFWNELKEEIRNALALTEQFTPEVVDEAIAIVGAWYDYDLNKVVGDGKKTIHECMKENTWI